MALADLPPFAAALLLVCTANTAAWAAGRLPGRAAPLDGGLRLPDGERLLGAHKTWRGLAAGVAACALLALALGAGWRLGALFGLLALLGDALSSAAKRRLRRPPGTELPLLDQLPEALLPLVACAGALGLGAADVIGVAAAFTLLDVLATGVRKRPARGG